MLQKAILLRSQTLQIAMKYIKRDTGYFSIQVIRVHYVYRRASVEIAPLQVLPAGNLVLPYANTAS